MLTLFYYFLEICKHQHHYSKTCVHIIITTCYDTLMFHCNTARVIVTGLLFNSGIIQHFLNKISEYDLCRPHSDAQHNKNTM